MKSLIQQMRKFLGKASKANKKDIELALSQLKKVMKFGKILHHGKDQKWTIYSKWQKSVSGETYDVIIQQQRNLLETKKMCPPFLFQMVNENNIRGKENQWLTRKLTN